MRAVADSVGGGPDDEGMGEPFGLSPKASVGPVGDLDWHRELQADRHRVLAFRQAVREAVSPGDVVVDIGTGTGPLALPAVGAGATRVYAIERGEIIVLARQIARQNGLEDRISFIQGDSRHVELERRCGLGRGRDHRLPGAGRGYHYHLLRRQETSSNREGACYRMASISSSPLPRKGST